MGQQRGKLNCQQLNKQTYPVPKISDRRESITLAPKCLFKAEKKQQPNNTLSINISMSSLLKLPETALEDFHSFTVSLKMPGSMNIHTCHSKLLPCPQGIPII